MGIFNFVYRFINRNQISVKDVVQYLKKIESPIILEAGAADGSDTLRFSELIPHGVIYAFEPVEQNYEVVQKKINLQKNVFLFKLALGDYNGKDLINISNNTHSTDNVASSSSLLKPKLHIETHPQITFEKQEETEIKTIDAWANENNIDHIDAMWLDMQGAEFKTLKASPIIMKTVKVIYTEVNFIEMYEGCGLYEEYRDWLFSQGFKLKKKEFSWKEQGNALFVRD